MGVGSWGGRGRVGEREMVQVFCSQESWEDGVPGLLRPEPCMYFPPERPPKSLGQSSWTDMIIFSIFPLPLAGLFTEFQADFQKRTWLLIFWSKMPRFFSNNCLKKGHGGHMSSRVVEGHRTGLWLEPRVGLRESSEPGGQPPARG